MGIYFWDGFWNRKRAVLDENFDGFATVPKTILFDTWQKYQTKIFREKIFSTVWVLKATDGRLTSRHKALNMQYCQFWLDSLGNKIFYRVK